MVPITPCRFFSTDKNVTQTMSVWSRAKEEAGYVQSIHDGSLCLFQRSSNRLALTG